jgi:hypothetical protein
MRCKDYGVKQIMVGLHQVGVVGLRKALQQVDDSGVSDREAIVDRLIEILVTDNYIPDRTDDDFRMSIWREYLRHRGEDISPFFSRVAVSVRGEPGERRDEFVAMAKDVFAGHELAPDIGYDDADDGGNTPELLIDDHVVVAGMLSRTAFNTAVRKSFSDW